MKNLVENLERITLKDKSATCLTGIASDATIMHNYSNFIKDSRVNKFEAEDFYLKRHLLSDIEEMARTGQGNLGIDYKMRPTPNPFQSFVSTQASKNTLYGLKMGHRLSD